MKRLDAKVSVAGQIMPGDVPALKAACVTMIVNNRPDGEAPGQPDSAEIAQAAGAAGIGYRHIPVAGGFDEAMVEAMTSALEKATGPVLAFCKSGTRSTLLWALARARLGDDPEELRTKAEAAGYDLSPIARWLQSH